MDKRKALGRGLGALLPDAPGTGSTAVKRDYFVVGIEEVHPSGQNPRQGFDEGQLAELIQSIRQQGIIQPLVVRTRPAVDGGGFTLIAGERRWRAAQKAGLKSIPVVVKEATAKEAFELALVENLQRADLNPIEEAEGYRRMCDEFGYTQEQLAERVGKDRTTIVNALRLLKHPPSVRQLVAAGRLQAGHARALLGLDNVQKIEDAATRVAEGGLSVRQTEELVRREKTPPHSPRPPAVDDPRSADGATTAVLRSPAIADLEKRLQRALGVRGVRVIEKNKQSGKIEVDYTSLDELDRLLQLLRA